MNSFYSDPTVGGDGSTTTDDADLTTGLANGGHRTRFVPALAQIVAIGVWVKNRALDVFGYANAASASATAAGISETNAAISETNAAGSETAAAAGATSALSVVQQDLSAISMSFFTSVTLVDACWYDTALDSDGGAWRKRCSHTSWYQESIVAGNWLGEATNETTARAITGAGTGSYYHNTTDGKFYSLNAGSGQTEIFRGRTREFPAQTIITVESARVVIWDAGQNNGSHGPEMWMVFSSPTAYGHIKSNASGTPGITSVRASNGKVICCGSVGSYVGLYEEDFISDGGYVTVTSGKARHRNPISGRNATNGSPLIISSSGIVSNACNAVALTALPSAPIDIATGLPVPTIAVATNGNATYSTSVIKDDGTVVNIASDSTGTAVAVDFDGLTLKVIRSDGTVYVWNDASRLTTGQSPDAMLTASSTPALLGTVSKETKRAKGSSSGVTLLRRNQITLASSIIVYITKDYNSGWQPGDIRGAWLADTVVETMTGAELVTNGTFPTDTSGWTASNATLSVVSGAMRVTVTANGVAYAGQAITCNIGKSYTVGVQFVTDAVTGNYFINIGMSMGSAATGQVNAASSTGLFSITFVATATTHYVSVASASDALAAEYFDVDNITCRLADVDRSVKAGGLQTFGSITKAVVASGAQLVGYSGWSAANYLEQPYNSGLDFGTGDFYIAFWEKLSSLSSTVFPFHRSLAATGGGIAIAFSGTGQIVVYLTASSTFTARLTATAGSVASGVRALVEVYRRSGTLYIVVNGVVITSVADSTNITYANTLMRVGCQSDGSFPLTGDIALFRISATVPSDEQRKYIYETEKYLFAANAQCCLAGSSNAITALAYDEEADLVHAGTSWGRSAFNGLVRVAGETTTVGSIKAIAAGGNAVAQAGDGAARFAIPARNLREELDRKNEQMAARLRRVEPIMTSTAAGKTLVPGEVCLVTVAGTTQTLPSSPVAGDECTVMTASAIVNTVVARNGYNLNALAEDMTLNFGDDSTTFRFIDPITGWRMK